MATNWRKTLHTYNATKPCSQKEMDGGTNRPETTCACSRRKGKLNTKTGRKTPQGGHLKSNTLSQLGSRDIGFKNRTIKIATSSTSKQRTFTPTGLECALPNLFKGPLIFSSDFLFLLGSEVILDVKRLANLLRGFAFNHVGHSLAG